MTSNASYNLGYAMGQIVMAAVIIGGLTWLIVWAVRNSRSMSAHAESSQALVRARLGLVDGETTGPVWTAVHPTGAPMLIAITSVGVLALNYSAGDSAAIRVPYAGLTVSVGQAFPPKPRSSEPQVEIHISSPEFAPFKVLVDQSVATQILTWVSPRS